VTVFNPAYRKIIVERTRAIMGDHRRDDGSLDKPAIETEVRDHLLGQLTPLERMELRSMALDFTVHEYVKWTIRNTKPDGYYKGNHIGDRRRAVYSVPRKDGRGFDAKAWEDLTADDLKAMSEHADRQAQRLKADAINFGLSASIRRNRDEESQ